MSTANQPTTRIFKGRDGFEAETKVYLGITKRWDDQDLPRVLEVSTRKALAGGLYSLASVHAERGGSILMEFGGDFHKRLIVNKAARCTEKSVTAMHQQAISSLAELVEEAKAFYAKRAEQAA